MDVMINYENFLKKKLIKMVDCEVIMKDEILILDIIEVDYVEFLNVDYELLEMVM